jgi:hypothetical protein
LALGWCGFAAAAEPARFAADAFAQPIAAAAVADESLAHAAISPSDIAADASPAPLRWKSKTFPTSTSTTSSSAPTVARVSASRSQPAGSGWNRTRIDGQVRPAQAISGSDPFSDPFGDRSAVRTASDIELEPTEAESGNSSTAPTTGVEELPLTAPRVPQSTGQPALLPVDEMYTAQPGPNLSPLRSQPMDELPSPATGAPCDRVYNQRDCCAIEAGCRAFREQLISDSIRNISLDITPRFMPDLTLEEDEVTRQDRLRGLESRSWRNRRGELVATGRMTNLSSGRVIITDDAGTEVARLPWSELGDDEICYINAFWRLPVECTLGGRETVARNWIHQTYQWQASALCHKPLYFEEVQLERYGHTTGPFTQPFVSGAHFFFNIAVLPYHMGYQPPHECQYALGYYRPGSCAPWMIPPVPLSLRGAAAQTGAVLGGVYLIP